MTTAEVDVPNPARTTVALVVGQSLVGFAIRTLVEQEPDLVVVDEAGSLEEARRQLPAIQPDVLVVSAELPDGDGLELCQELSGQATNVLVLAVRADDELLVESMRAGASGFALTADRGEEIVTAVRTVGRGGAHFSGAATPRMVAIVASGGVVDHPLAHLTDRERSVLDLLGEGLSNRQIAERLYLGERTVKNYVSRLLRTLDMESRTEAAVFAARLDERRSRGRRVLTAD